MAGNAKVVVGIIGLLVGLLFAKLTGPGMATFYEFYIKYPEFRPNIIICATVGLVIGLLVGFVIDSKKTSKA